MCQQFKKVFLNYFVGRGHSSEATALLTTATYLRETLPIKVNAGPYNNKSVSELHCFIFVSFKYI